MTKQIQLKPQRKLGDIRDDAGQTREDDPLMDGSSNVQALMPNEGTKVQIPNRASPWVMQNSVRRKETQVTNAAAPLRRQSMQWQCVMLEGRPVAWYRTQPHR